MSATDISTLPQESKQQDAYSGKDDQKQQAALRKKETKQSKADIPVDAGSSLVGGAIGAVQHAVDAGIHMLPESLQTRAESLQSTLTTQASALADKAAPVIESYQKDGLVAAAKVAGGLGAGIGSSAIDSASASTAGLKKQALDAGAALQQKLPTTESLKKQLPTADSIKQKLPTAASLKEKLPTAASLKEKLPASLANKLPVALVLRRRGCGGLTAKGRRRRGGRGHGNRKLKTRALPIHEAESIKDSLGEKAAEIKDIIVEDVKKAEAAAPGLIGSIQARAAGLVNGVSASIGGARDAASGLVSNASASASGLIAAGQSKIATLTGNAKEAAAETLEVNNLKPKMAERKPTLERRDELPALGTPNTPNDKDVLLQTGKPMAVNASGNAASSGILGTAAFYGQQLMDVIKEKAEDLSSNGDDTKPMENESTLAKAKHQLDGLKEAVVAKVDEVKKGAKGKKGAQSEESKE